MTDAVIQPPYPFRQPRSPGECPPFYVDGFKDLVYERFMAGETTHSLTKTYGLYPEAIEKIIRGIRRTEER